MDEVKAPHPWVTPGIILPAVKLPENPTSFKDLVLEQIHLRYGISIEEMRARFRGRHVVYVRQLFCHLMQTCYGTKASLNWLANILDAAEHTGIMYSRDNFKDLLDTNANMSKNSLKLIQGDKFATIPEDYNHFKLILYKCLQPNIILSASQVELDQVKTLWPS